jgi:hypothetical protein
MLRKKYKAVSKSFQTGHLEQELQMIQLSTTRCSCYHYFVSPCNEFCHYNPSCCF